MRGSFNRTMVVRYGQRSLVGPPGVTYASGVPCRRVLQRRIEQGQFDFTLAHHWVTQDTVVLNPPLTSSPYIGAIFTDQLAADEVSFDDDPDVWYSVCRHETISPRHGAEYWRDLVIPTTSIVVPPWPPPVSPPPPPSPPGPPVVPPGESCGSPSVIDEPGEYVVSSLPGAMAGQYRIDLPPGEQWYIRFLSCDDTEWRIDPLFHVPEVSCCAFEGYLGPMNQAGTHCRSFGPVDMPMVLCFSVGRESGISPVVDVTIEVGVGGCP